MGNLSIDFIYEYGNSNTKKLKMKFNNTSLDDIDTTYLLAEVGEKIITINYNNIILDFSSVEYMNSSGFGSLMNIQKSATKNNKTISFLFNNKVKSIINATSFEKMADVVFV